jgi:hypothetical protein
MYARNVYAKSLQDVSNLRYQDVFMMGTAGSGKTYVSHKWMKFMPGGGASGRGQAPDRTGARPFQPEL